MRTLVFCACAAVALAAHAQQDNAAGQGGTGSAAQQGSATQGATGAATQQTTQGETGSAAQQPSGGAPQGMHHTAPTPNPLLTDAFKGSVGSWRCTGVMTMPKEMGGGEMKSRSQMTIRRELNGFLYEGEWRVEKSQHFPEMRGKMAWSYDPQAKKLVQFAVDGAGNISRGESDGAQDGKIVWTEEGTMMGKPSKMRTTVAMTAPQKIELTFEQQGEGGAWQPMGKDSCTKAGATTSASSK